MIHRTRYRRYGNPEASYVRKSWYEDQTELARRILRVNTEHPGHQYSIRFIKRVLDGSIFSNRRRMSQYSFAWQNVNLQAETVLHHMVGLRRFYDLDIPMRMIRTHKQFLYQLGALMIVELGKPARIGFPSRKVPDADRLYLGKLINRQIGVFLLAASRAITMWEGVEAQRKKDLSSPFNLAI